MSTLYRFEDKFGCFSLINAFHKDIVSHSESGLSTQHILMLRAQQVKTYADLGYSRVIDTFDMGPRNGNPCSIISKEMFMNIREKSVCVVGKQGVHMDLLYVPTVYAAETICLVQYWDMLCGYSPEALIHTENLYEFQLVLLSALARCNRIRDAKKVDDFLDIERLTYNLENNRISVPFNSVFVNWLLNGECVPLNADDVCALLGRVKVVLDCLRRIDVKFELGDSVITKSTPLDVIKEARNRYLGLGR